MAMSMFDNLRDAAEDAVRDNPDKVEEYSDQGIAKLGDVVDDLTGGKYTEHVDTAQAKGDEVIGE